MLLTWVLDLVVKLLLYLLYLLFEFALIVFYMNLLTEDLVLLLNTDLPNPLLTIVKCCETSFHLEKYFGLLSRDLLIALNLFF